MSKIIQDVNIGANIQKIRKFKGLTQDDMIAKLDLSGRPMIKTTYSQIETGKRNIFASDLVAVSRILNVTIDSFFENIEPVNKYEIKNDKRVF